MLSALEEKKSEHFVIENFKLYEELQNYEKKYNMNTFAMFYSENLSNDFLNWRRLFFKYLYCNGSMFKINKIKDIDYLVIPRKHFVTNIIEYLYDLRDYLSKNKNGVLVLTNQVYQYKKILEYCNENKILCLLLSNDPQDKYLDLSNLFIQIVKEPSIIAKKFPLKIIQYGIDEI